MKIHNQHILLQIRLIKSTSWQLLIWNSNYPLAPAYLIQIKMRLLSSMHNKEKQKDFLAKMESRNSAASWIEVVKGRRNSKSPPPNWILSFKQSLRKDLGSLKLIARGGSKAYQTKVMHPNSIQISSASLGFDKNIIIEILL